MLMTSDAKFVYWRWLLCVCLLLLRLLLLLCSPACLVRLILAGAECFFPYRR